MIMAGPINQRLSNIIITGVNTHTYHANSARSFCPPVRAAKTLCHLRRTTKHVTPSQKGLVNGRLSWNEQTRSTMFEPFTRLSGRSISANSIESADDGSPLRLELWPSQASRAAPFLSGGDQSNCMAVDHHGGADGPARLKIGAKSLILSSLAPNPTTGNDSSTPTRLLEFDGERESITLPNEARLRLSPRLAGSITARARLSCPQISGSLEDDFK